MITDRGSAAGGVEGRGISPGVLVRWSGLSAMASGASIFVAPFLHPDDPRNAAWVPMLIGVFARQLPRSGPLGLAGFLTAFVGTSMMLLEGREHLFSHDFGQGTPARLWQLVAASFVFSAGYIMLGAAVFQARVLPRAAGVLLAVGGPIVAFSPPIGIPAVLIVGHTLFGAGLVWLGHALWDGAGGAPKLRR